MHLAGRLNKYIDETAPWVLAKSEESLPRLGAVLYNLLEGIRFLAVMLIPVIPEASAKIFTQLGDLPDDMKTPDSLSNFGLLKEGEKVGAAEVLFARIDPKKLLPEIDEFYKSV
jgi:methionyl-tRNA synthetase